jgi:hypothetical protein
MRMPAVMYLCCYFQVLGPSRLRMRVPVWRTAEMRHRPVRRSNAERLRKENLVIR